MITAIVLTKNEEKNIKECLEGLNWCDELLVIDDNSEDNTTKIAKECGAKVLDHSLDDDFAAQRNFGLSKAQSEWIFFVDADERVSKKLGNEIEEKIKEDNKVEGYYLKRNDYFLSRLLRYGETGSLRILRLGRKNSGKWNRRVDEVWGVKGQTETLENPLLHFSHSNLVQFLESINKRSTLNAQYLFENGYNLNLFEWSKPFLKFIQNYLLKLGFLDGVRGFIFAVLMSLHSFLVRGKLYLLLVRGEKGKKVNRGKVGDFIFIVWIIIVFISYLYFLFQRGLLRWSN